MIKQRTIIEVEVNGRPFQFECVSESTWQEVLAANDLIINFAKERLNAALSAQTSPEEKTESS
jgi:hypothetical protein